jgi:hypothetical protein
MICGGLWERRWRTRGFAQRIGLALAAKRRNHLRVAPCSRNCRSREAYLSDTEPIVLRSRNGANHFGPAAHSAPLTTVAFTIHELRAILNLYGRKVAAGEWRDYAMDFGREKAVFSVFRRASECPLYTIEKNPRLARKQGAYGVIAASGLILKRGPDLARVLAVLDRPLKLVDA